MTVTALVLRASGAAFDYDEVPPVTAAIEPTLVDVDDGTVGQVATDREELIELREEQGREDRREKAEYEAWIKEGSPEALEAAAKDAEYEKIMAKVKASEARRIKREAMNPPATLDRARVVTQREEMQSDTDEARSAARQDGESWSDIKDEWQQDWLETNWTAEAEPAFIVSFESRWLNDHGKPFPELVDVEPELVDVVDAGAECLERGPAE
jgi:hypothetical protein